MLLKLYVIAPALLLLAGLAAQPASAQAGERWPARSEAVAQRRAQMNRARRPNVRVMEGLPPKWLEKLREMPPAQQQRFLQNNERFRNLPPQRQEQIRRNLERWNNLSPEQKQAARNAEEALERMTPQQRAYVRNTLLPKWQALPMNRRQVIRRHLAMLSRMGPSTQQAALNDPRFMAGLSPDEQDILRSLNSLRNPAPPLAVSSSAVQRSVPGK
ncbi:MAG TPA: DUF3106 domain-containing protein [Candidatus Dormibacteraeota bacterium]|nr:DUF3106 domain-containing protein [Candidatus Dormibacteraeota bacterium]